jgi:nucleoside-diphosphate-sugar epimerase
MSTIVITGAGGYIGSALANRLASEGHSVRLVSRAKRIALTGAHNVETILADLCDVRSWSSLLEGADAVAHLSWRTDLRAAEADPINDANLNVEPVHALVRAAQCLKNSPVVAFASTVTISGVNPRSPVDEQIADDPCSVYDSHKLVCEHLLRDATVGGALRACTLRLSNVYGFGSGAPSTNPNRGILNSVMRQAARREAVSIYGRGEYLRDFVFIDDIVDAFYRALTNEQVCDGSHYVIATGQGHTLLQAFQIVAQEAERLTGRVVEIHHVPEPADLHPIERRNFVGDSSRFQRRSGWYPQTDLRSGIRDYFKRMSSVASPSAGAPDEAA